MNLSGKKILFLSPNFFGYEKAIQKKLESLGAHVDFYNERPSDTVFTKGIIRVKKSFFQKSINQYYSKILNEISHQSYDFFLLIKGETIPLFFLEEFSVLNSASLKIFYAYDAVCEYPKSVSLYPYFDKNFTFEPGDAITYKLHFRPLFFLDNFRIQKQTPKKYDITFIGSAHTDRYVIGEKVKHFAKILNLNTFFYYYTPGKTVFALKKLFDKTLQKFDEKKLSFKKLKHSEIMSIYEESFSVLDINKPIQKGLTMRTFEALAAGKKLITTNTDLINYPFYSLRNTTILNRDDIVLHEDFFKSPFQELESNVLEKMSLNSWIHCLFFEHQDDYWQVEKFK